MPKVSSIVRQPWVEHDFPHDIPRGWTANIMSRVRDTPVRLLYYAQHPAREPENVWNLKEHIGHLIELEKLHQNRLLQFARKVEELEPADMSNAATNQANYQEYELEELVAEFEKVREQSIRTYEALDPETHEHQALHPRLKIKMRPVDMLFFMAEHDDHHLASIWELVE